MSEVTGYLEQVDNETYRLRAVLGYKPDGSAKRKSKTIKANSKRAAYKELNIWLEQFEGMTDDSLDLFNITFGEFYRKIWLSEAEKNLEPKSYHNYKRMIENRFLDKFDFIPLIDIKPYMIKKIVVNAQRINTKDPGRNSDKPLSRNTKLRMLYAVNNLFLMAKNEYGAIKENPVENVKIPKEKGVKKNIEEPYSEEEIHAMLKAAFEES
ncbi:TPA: site-specific integrase, partial [Enterococcus faecium]|nr:site-specific integrase [Enterococcus faecium]